MFTFASIIFILENSSLYPEGVFVDMLDTTYFFWVVSFFCNYFFPLPSQIFSFLFFVYMP